FYGAAKIATESAVKTGSGLVTLISDVDVQEKLCTVFAEAMTVNYSEKERVKKLLDSSNAIGIGPGMGDNNNTLKIVESILKEAKSPVIIDADGINCLKNNKNILRDSKKEVLITPHPAELSRITGFSMEYINENRIDAAKEAARNLKSVVLLKGNRTVITDGYTTYINMTGNSAMANGGMGDCLTGIITSLAGQNIPLLESAVVGAYLHGYIGDKIAEEKYTVNASDIIEKISYIMKEFEML
ncbi:MAG: NAD(P)H-hydrate dehydratase, partial [Peptacetobacter hiranonis]|nr:NAD(P)H-hydrate dehydratase [Peptacetobacter hiranonis]